MPRRARARAIVGGLIYHILNRSNGRLPLFRIWHPRKTPFSFLFERVVRATRLVVETTEVVSRQVLREIGTL